MAQPSLARSPRTGAARVGLIGLAAALSLAPAMARAQLVDLRTNWTTKTALPTYCQDQKQARFVVQGPGKLTLNLTLTPYRSAGRMAYIPMTWAQFRPDGGTPGWGESFFPGHQYTKFYVAGREVGNFVEGAPLEMRRVWILDAKRYDAGVLLGAPCQSFGGSGFAQFSQAQHLVLTFEPTGGQSAASSAPTTTAGTPRTLYDNGNAGGVGNGPTRETSFTLSAPTRITRITDYHWNNGLGAPAGTIGLRGPGGQVYGPWRASLRGKAYWIVTPNVVLPAGRYAIIDSGAATWAQNAGSGGAGMTVVEGASP